MRKNRDSGKRVGSRGIVADVRRSVLLFESDDPSRDEITTSLVARGLHVVGAATVPEVLQRLSIEKFATVVLDVSSGDELSSILDLIQHECPTALVLVMAGAKRPAFERIQSQLIHGVIKKPYDIEDVTNLIESCIEVRDRSSFETMVAMIVAGPFVAWLSRL